MNDALLRLVRLAKAVWSGGGLVVGSGLVFLGSIPASSKLLKRSSSFKIYSVSEKEWRIKIIRHLGQKCEVSLGLKMVFPAA